MTTSPFYKEVLSRLDAVRKKTLRLELFYGLLSAALFGICLLLLIVVPNQIFSFGIVGRTILFVAGIFGALCIAGWYVVRPVLKLFGIVHRESYESLALRVGSYFPLIRDRLFDVLQLYEGREVLHENYSVSLIDASFDDLYRQIQPLEFTESIADHGVRRMRKFLLYGFGVFLLVFVVSPSGFFGSLYQVVRFQESFAAQRTVELTVDPGNIEAVRGQTIPITVYTKGTPPSRLSLYARQHGQVDFEKQNLAKTADGIFKAELRDLKASTEYFASCDESKSDTYTITMLDRPVVRSLKLSIASPSYTRIPPKVLDENTGDITALAGSRVHVEILSSKELADAAVNFSDSTTLPLKIASSSATESFVIRKNLTYHLALKDRNGLMNIDPVEYSIKVIPDEYPTVEIISPGRNIDLTEEMKLDIMVRARDDFGFSRLRLGYRLTQSKYEKAHDEFSFIDIPIQQPNQNIVEESYRWDLSSMNLVPEDAVAYFVEVFDNDNFSGPKSGKSETYIVRLPSLEEVFSDVNEAHDQSMTDMQSAATEAEQLRKNIEDLQQEMKKNQSRPDWQAQKKAEDLGKHYEEMQKKLDEAAKKVDELVKKMEENKLLSPQTLEKYQELQKLMEQLNSPELRAAMKKLQEMMKQQQQLSPDQMKQAMEQLKANEDNFRKSLERTIELLKRIHIEQKLEELVERTEQLQREQQSVNEQTKQTDASNTEKRDELSQRQEDLRKKTDSLEKEASELQQKMEEFPKEMPLEEMQKARQQMNDRKTAQKMQHASQQLQSGDMQGAEQNGEASEKDLTDLKEQMQQVQKSMQSMQQKQIANQMKKQVQNMLELSKRQESLKEETKTLEPNSRRFREGTQQQSDMLNDLNNVANQTAELGKKTFAITPEMGKQLGMAMQEMNDAMKQMEGRNPNGSADRQGEAMSSLNRAAMMMENALSGMMNGNQGGMGMAGLMSQLNQMAGQQGGINQGTQQAMGMGQGMSAEQQAEYQRLSSQQGSVQKSLKQLTDEAKNSGDLSKLMGDLERTVQDMQEVQSDLEQGNVNPNTLHKQDRILSRLLESTRSMRERDFEKKRKSESGKDLFKPSPAEINLSTQEGRDKLREELLQLNEAHYTKDYELLIKNYFEALEKAEDENK